MREGGSSSQPFPSQPPAADAIAGCLISCHNSVQVSDEVHLFEFLMCQWRDTHKRVIAAQNMHGREVSESLPAYSICAPQMLERSPGGAARSGSETPMSGWKLVEKLSWTKCLSPPNHMLKP